MAVTANDVQWAQLLPLRADVAVAVSARAGQKWLMAHATHTPRFSADSARFLSSSASVAAATVTNDVVVFVVVDVGCWLSIRMLVDVVFACSDLWSAGGCCGDGCFLILIKQFYFLVRFFFLSQERCRKCVLSCFVITSSRFPQILFSSFITLFRFSFALFSNKKKVEKINLEITIALRIFSFF